MALKGEKMCRLNIKKENQKGAAAIEMAIVLPLLIVLVFGIIEFSLLMYNKNIIAHAAREGARTGVVYAQPRVSTTQIEEEVNRYIANNLISFSAATPSVNIADGICPINAGLSQELRVSVAYTYSFLLLPNFLGTFFSGGMSQGIPVGSEAVMRCE